MKETTKNKHNRVYANYSSKTAEVVTQQGKECPCRLRVKCWSVCVSTAFLRPVKQRQEFVRHL